MASAKKKPKNSTDMMGCISGSGFTATANRRLSLGIANYDELDGLMYKGSPLVNSPLTSLALNLGDLDASLDGTPKRRISWSSVGSTSPVDCRSTSQMLAFNQDIGLGGFDSPVTSKILSPGSQDRPFKEVSAMVNAPVLRKLFPLSTMSCSSTFGTASTVGGKENSPRWPSPIKEPLREEDDGSSLDSGFSDKDEKQGNFHFMEPKGLAPRRQRTSSSDLLPAVAFGRNPSLSDVESDDGQDDGFLDIPDPSALQDQVSTMPSSLSKLIEGNWLTTLSTVEAFPRSPLKEFPHVQENTDHTPNVSVRSCSRGLFAVDGWTKEGDKGRRGPAGEVNLDRKLAFKRPDAAREFQSPLHNKRRKSLSFCYRNQEYCGHLQTNKDVPNTLELLRSKSVTEATIMNAVQLSDQDPNLIGDFTKTYALPLIEGRHQDLKSISHETVRQLLSGDFTDAIERCIIVDCRYPYEFDGGHIRGAMNIYTKEGILQEFLNTLVAAVDANKRLVIIFHCEFSSERGPNLSRFLRNKDRESNQDCYPHLHYPELYLLEGGYKGFFENHKAFCEPQDYMPMLDKEHEKELRHFRAKSKSWNGDKSARMPSLSSRPGIKF